MIFINKKIQIPTLLFEAEYKQMMCHTIEGIKTKWDFYEDKTGKKVAGFTKHPNSRNQLLVGLEKEAFFSNWLNFPDSINLLESELDMLNLGLSRFTNPIGLMADSSRKRNIVKNGMDWYGVRFGKEALKYLELQKFIRN